MRKTKIDENLESRSYANEERARRELYGEISDLFHIAGEFPQVLVLTFGSGPSLVPFENYTPKITLERRDPKEYPTGFVTDLLTEIISPEKFRLIDVYSAQDEVQISGPSEDVRKIYTEWARNSN